jgi:hypothetical protein
MDRIIKKYFLLMLFIILSVAFLAGCASVKSDASMVYEDTAAYPEAAYEMEAMEAPAPEMPPTTMAYSEASQIEQKIIKTAFMEIEILKGSFDANFFYVIDIAQKNGGYVSNTQSYSDTLGNMTAGYITIRVPSERFNAAIEELKTIGTIKSTQISGVDVTQEFVDLESRLKNLEAQEEVLLALMEQSRTVEDSIEVQRELSYVQGEIEVIKGRMRYLESMVSFSTIDVSIFEPEPIETQGFLNAIRRGLRGAVNVLNGLVFFLIAASPILVLMVVIIIIIWLSLRVRHRRRAARNNNKEQK